MPVTLNVRNGSKPDIAFRGSMSEQCGVGEGSDHPGSTVAARLARARVPVGILLLVALSFGLGFALAHYRFGAPADPASSSQLSSDAAAKLGAHLMGRVGQRFVAAEQHTDGVRFYDQPKPYGSWLCRVNSYWVPQKIVTGEEVRGQDWWADDLSMTRRYGIWRRPSGPEASDAARHKACAGLRAFDTTFEAAGDPAEPERAVYLLERLIMAARAGGRLPFPVQCLRWIKLDEKPQRCDGITILRRFSLRDLYYAKVIFSDHGEEFGSSRDELRIASTTDKDVTLTIESRQHWGRHSMAEGEVRSVAVVVDASH